jgi:biopolymer transport protein ExbD
MIQLTNLNKNRFKLDMAPLIDVVFLLLIFFMLTFAVQGQGMDISLPENQSGETKAEQSLTIKIEFDNSIRVNKQIIGIENLHSNLEKKLKEKNEKLVVIEADVKTNYDFFAKVLDIARQAGAKDFSIIM